ncbi:MAG: alpha-L-fucosidase [Ruminococcaceae bacterium]|nr:alpha-L-fucosidase [Oscillospiraceae bacterium]
MIMCKDQLPIAPEYIKKFEQLGLGMFVHFGLYSQLKQGEWTMHLHNISKEDYMPLKETFNPVSMAEIVSVGKSAGCKYICLTTRHHEGFSLYDTRGLNDYDAIHSPAGRDVVREFVDECRKADIVPFFYHTTLDWYREDFNNDFNGYLEYLRKSVEILCTHYGEIGGLWFDGNWSKPDADWQEDALYSMIRRLQPNAMIINNTGIHKRGEKGNEYIDSLTYERGTPTPIDRRGMTKYVAGEMCETLNDNWGDADDINFKPVKQIIEEICDCRKIGANMLLNIGPCGDGTVPLMSRAMMDAVGYWMSIYGKSIYNGRPYIVVEGKRDFILRDIKDPNTFYLFKYNLGMGGDTNVALDGGAAGVVEFDGFGETIESVNWMDDGAALNFSQNGTNIKVGCPNFRYGKSHCVRVAEIKVK